MSQLKVDDATIARLRKRADKPIPPDTTLRRRAIERDLAKCTADHAARRMATDAYLAEHARLTGELDMLAVARPETSLSDGDHIVRFLRDTKSVWEEGGQTERASLVASVYDRIVATDQGIVEVELTEDAMRHRLAISLPERLMVALARPAGLEPTTFRSAT